MRHKKKNVRSVMRPQIGEGQIDETMDNIPYRPAEDFFRLIALKMLNGKKREKFLFFSNPLLFNFYSLIDRTIVLRRTRISRVQPTKINDDYFFLIKNSEDPFSVGTMSDINHIQNLDIIKQLF